MYKYPSCSEQNTSGSTHLRNKHRVIHFLNPPQRSRTTTSRTNVNQERDIWRSHLDLLRKRAENVSAHRPKPAIHWIQRYGSVPYDTDRRRPYIGYNATVHRRTTPTEAGHTLDTTLRF